MEINILIGIIAVIMRKYIDGQDCMILARVFHANELLRYAVWYNNDVIVACIGCSICIVKIQNIF